MSTSSEKQQPQRLPELTESIKKAFDAAPDKGTFINDLRRFIHSISPWRDQPVDLVLWVPMAEIVANEYNPNAVAANEMKLLRHSIDMDGYTQPIVSVLNPKRAKFEVVDGFHRYTVGRSDPEIQDRIHGRLPVVTIDKPMADRMASTVRHNRARGKHSVSGMANLVYQMLDEGKDDADICKALGMEADELVRLKHVTWFSKLFENVEYRKAWETRRQLEARLKWESDHGRKALPESI